jgi:DNA-binding transcriptional MerR regulator
VTQGDATGGLFSDGKASDAMRTIGEVARALGIKTHVLRYWEQQFPMLRPLQRSGGRRYYRAEDVALVERIDRLINREGYTLKGARQVLEAASGRAPASPAPPVIPAVAVRQPSPELSRRAELLPKLRSVRERLAQALEV